MKTKKLLSLMVVAWVLLLAGVAHAAVINVNFFSLERSASGPFDYTGGIDGPFFDPADGGSQFAVITPQLWSSNLALIPYEGTRWNNATAALGNLNGGVITSEGTFTNIEFTVSNMPVSSFNYVYSGPDPSTVETQDNYFVVHDGQPGPITVPLTMTIGGLTAHSLYDIALGAQGVGQDVGTRFNIGNQQYGTIQLESAGSRPFTPGWVEGENAVWARSVRADSNGEIFIDVYSDSTNDANPDFGVVSWLQIDTNPVPEPSTFLMVMIGYGFLFKRRR